MDEGNYIRGVTVIAAPVRAYSDTLSHVVVVVGETWAEDCLWMWDSWSTPFGQDRPPLLIGDADTVTRIIENALRHVPFREMFLLFGQGILERDRCLKTLELFAEQVIPRFR